ncbi:MAG: DUF1295 domain-containing protein [Bacteroidales bacterium]|nr:DUF1295 domain-containing protein [Bacteroidales bacterium]
MKKIAIIAVLIGLSIVACPILYFQAGPALDAYQLETLRIILTICAVSIAYCFIVGELTLNNSQMDKLWSLLPEIYLWVIAARGGMSPRLVVMAVLATIWGARLTYNFAKKGAYSIRFWSGEEDYRWVYLRARKEFQPRWKWAIFDLFFISTYQNLLVLMTTFPALVAMNSDKPFGIVDCLAAVLMLGFICYEATADVQQWKFQSTKWGMIKSGKKLEELPAPYNRGFNTSGLWKLSRHPNYFGEQGTWVALYIFSIGAGIGIFNWSIIGALLLIVLFQGSSFFGEWLSSQKYPEYKHYCESINKFFPGKPYKG